MKPTATHLAVERAISAGLSVMFDRGEVPMTVLSDQGVRIRALEEAIAGVDRPPVVRVREETEWDRVAAVMAAEMDQVRGGGR